MTAFVHQLSGIAHGDTVEMTMNMFFFFHKKTVGNSIRQSAEIILFQGFLLRHPPLKSV